MTDQEQAWDSFYRSNGRAWRGNCTLPGIPRGTGEALDIGCGAGKSTESLMALGYRVCGADLSSEAVTLCRARFGDRAEFVRSGVADMPYPDSTFDCAVAVHVLEHVSDDEMPCAASEIRRVLKPGAWLFIRDFAPGDMRESGRRGSDIEYVHRGPEDISRFFDEFDIVSAEKVVEPTRFGTVRIRSELLMRNRRPGMTHPHGYTDRKRNIMFLN